jgi:chemotaxis protein MotB
MNGDGLEISIFDNNTHRMFKKNSAELTEEAKIILAKIVQSITYLPNNIIIGGHTEKMNSNSVDAYTGWDLSAGRASNAMKAMQVYGLPEEKITKLVAHGDNLPLDIENPYAEKNSRITITVLTSWSTVDHKKPISNTALSLDK